MNIICYIVKFINIFIYVFLISAVYFIFEFFVFFLKICGGICRSGEWGLKSKCCIA